MTVQEPNLLWQNIAVWVVPFLGYFVGICIRKIALPGQNSPPLRHQLLLGVPVALVIVSPILTIMRSGMSVDITIYLFNLGIVVEHGMLVQETATTHLTKLAKRDGSV
jgi:hypothetical protein